MKHHADRAVPALGEGRPRVGEALERKVMHHQAFHVDLTARDQRERTPGDALRVRERAEHVDVAAYDRREVETRQLGPESRRAAEHDAAPAARGEDGRARRLGRAGELDDQVRAAPEAVDVGDVDHRVDKVAYTREPLAAADEQNAARAECARELRRAETDRAGPENDDPLAGGESAALERPERDADVVRPGAAWRRAGGAGPVRPRTGRGGRRRRRACAAGGS